MVWLSQCIAMFVGKSSPANVGLCVFLATAAIFLCSWTCLASHFLCNCSCFCRYNSCMWRRIEWTAKVCQQTTKPTLLQTLCLFNCYSNNIYTLNIHYIRACNITNYSTNVQQYFHKLKVSENAAHECSNCDTHAKECNKMFIMCNYVPPFDR